MIIIIWPSALSNVSTDVEGNIAEIMELLDNAEIQEKQFKVTAYFIYESLCIYFYWCIDLLY